MSKASGCGGDLGLVLLGAILGFVLGTMGHVQWVKTDGIALVKAYHEAKIKGVPVSIDTTGHLWLWDDKNRQSYEISTEKLDKITGRK